MTIKGSSRRGGRWSGREEMGALGNSVSQPKRDKLSARICQGKFRNLFCVPFERKLCSAATKTWQKRERERVERRRKLGKTGRGRETEVQTDRQTDRHTAS